MLLPDLHRLPLPYLFATMIITAVFVAMCIWSQRRSLNLCAYCTAGVIAWCAFDAYIRHDYAYVLRHEWGLSYFVLHVLAFLSPPIALVVVRCARMLADRHRVDKTAA